MTYSQGLIWTENIIVLMTCFDYGFGDSTFKTGTWQDCRNKPMGSRDSVQSGLSICNRAACGSIFIPSCTPCLKTSPYLINNLACSVASPSTPQHHTHNQPFISSQGIRIIVNNSIQLCIDCELGLQHRCNNVLHWFPKACEGVWRLHMLDMRRQGEGRTASHNKDWLYVWRQRWLSLIYTAA